MTAATCECGAPVAFPKIGLCRPCYMRAYRAAHPQPRRTPKPPAAPIPAPPGVAACACGAAVWVGSECQSCYHRRYSRERSARIAEKVQRFNLDGYRFTTDASLEHARGSLLGVVLRCEACGDQIGPVRSASAAAVEIADHLVRDHGVPVPQTTCEEPGCRNVRLGKGFRVGGELCRAHRDERARREWREAKAPVWREKQAAIEAQAQAARDLIAAQIAARTPKRSEP